MRDSTQSVDWDRDYKTLGDNVIKGGLYLHSVLYGYLPLGMLDQEDGRVSPDGICTRHVGVEREGILQGNDVPGHCYGQGGCLSQAGFGGFKG